MQEEIGIQLRTCTYIDLVFLRLFQERKRNPEKVFEDRIGFVRIVGKDMCISIPEVITRMEPLVPPDFKIDKDLVALILEDRFEFGLFIKTSNPKTGELYYSLM